MCEVLSQCFKLGLLQSKHGVASSSLSVDCLSLLDAQLFLRAQEFLHSLRSKSDEQLVEFLLEKVSFLLLALDRGKPTDITHHRILIEGYTEDAVFRILKAYMISVRVLAGARS